MPRKKKPDEPKEDVSKLTSEEAIRRLFPDPAIDAARREIDSASQKKEDDEDLMNEN
jgi:hypothetical protein